MLQKFRLDSVIFSYCPLLQALIQLMRFLYATGEASSASKHSTILPTSKEASDQLNPSRTIMNGSFITKQS
jgi:hypothetical protein